MNRYVSVAIAAAALGILSAGRAWGQFNLIDQTRTLTINENGTVGPTDSNTLTGNYNNSINGFITAIPIQGGPPESATAAASQNSMVSASVLSGQTQANCGESAYPTSASISGDSFYSVDFSVASPTPLALTDQYLVTDNTHEGGSDHIVDTITLTSNNGSGPVQVFTAGVPNGLFGLGPITVVANGPTTFNTTLIPGVTYNLTVDTNVHGQVGNTSTNASPTASMTFSTSVPEPASIAMILGVSGLMLARRRR